jgi:hypothetical protein
MKTIILLIVCATTILLVAARLEFEAIQCGIDGKCLMAFMVLAALIIREVIAQLIKHVIRRNRARKEEIRHCRES